MTSIWAGEIAYIQHPRPNVFNTARGPPTGHKDLKGRHECDAEGRTSDVSFLKEKLDEPGVLHRLRSRW